MSKVKSFVTATTIAVAASLAGGCVLHGSAGVTADVEPVDHRVVQVSPGVWVVENYHDPVFYSDGFYWERRGGYWYRSSYYNGGFVRVGYNVVPYRIRSVRRPSRYARYRGGSNARYRRARYNRSYRRANTRDRRYKNRSRVRDRRTNTRSRTRDRRFNNRSRVRDRRSNTRSRTRDRRSNTRSRTRDRRTNTRSRTRDRRSNTKSRTRDKRKKRTRTRNRRRR